MNLAVLTELSLQFLICAFTYRGRLLVGTALAFLFHLMVTYGMDNKAFNHIVSASSSSWLQEHVADMSERYKYAHFFITVLEMRCLTGEGGGVDLMSGFSP